MKDSLSLVNIMGKENTNGAMEIQYKEHTIMDQEQDKQYSQRETKNTEYK